jgi:sucrose phosphorylase
MNDLERTLYDHIVFIYGDHEAETIFNRIKIRLDRFRVENPALSSSSPSDRYNEGDSILITYADMVRQNGEAPLKTLAAFLEKFLKDVVSTIHILPFYPYSSDDGFSVIDYKLVNPDFGDWEDVVKIGENFRLMFDAVVNHISSQSVWFQGFLRGEPEFEDYFTVIEDGVDLTKVFRPRATPVLTPFETAQGKKLVWTTFSADQIDLNFANPDMLLEVIDILLFYAAHGAEFIRLDAVTFVWKEIGTTCINSAHTHRIVQCIRTIFDLVAPKVAVITETNVPHKDNIAYFGDGTNEAQMVYNFALPLLVLNAFHTGDVTILANWAETLDLPSDQVTFFNFLASHDGIGMLPVRNILDDETCDSLVERTLELGGFVSYKSNEDGSQSPYELNINYLDALSAPARPEGSPEMVADRFLSSQAILLALRGVPGIYFHSLFGSRSWTEGVEQTGRYRTINREKLDRGVLEAELNDPHTTRSQVFSGYREMLLARRFEPAFHPNSEQRVLRLHPSVFAVLRRSPESDSNVLCLNNLAPLTIELNLDIEPIISGGVQSFRDLLTGEKYLTGVQTNPLSLEPYQVLWLKLV